MLFGSATMGSLSAIAPEVEVDSSLGIKLGHVEWMQLSYELSGARTNFDLLPPSLHPTMPVVCTLQIWRAKGGDLGDFGLAQLRLSCRAGMRIRAYALKSVIDGERAAKTLTKHFGYGPEQGKVALLSRAHRVEGSVTVGGETVLHGAILQPTSCELNSIQHITSMHPVRTSEGLRLLQIDPAFDQDSLKRGDQALTVMNSDFWRIPGRTLKYPVIGVTGEASVELPPVQYLQPVEIAEAQTA